MIAHKKKFSLGLMMLIAFFAVLTLFFTPIFGDLNGLDYLDSLYNSISKGSAYYIPKLKDEAKTFSGNNVELSVAMANPTQAQQTSRLLTKTGATVSVTDATLKASGDLGKILDGVLADADAMYKNDGKAVADKYGFGERQALYTWWQAFKAIEKDLNQPEEIQGGQGGRQHQQKGHRSELQLLQGGAPEHYGPPGGGGLLAGVLRGLHPLVWVRHHVHVRRLGHAA